MKFLFTVFLLLSVYVVKAQCITMKELRWLKGKSLAQVNRFMQLRSYDNTDSTPFSNMVYVSYMNNKTGSNITVGFGAKTSIVWDIDYRPLVSSQCYNQVVPELISTGFRKDEETLYNGKILLAYSLPEYGVSIESPYNGPNGACYKIYIWTADEYTMFLKGVRYKKS